MARSFQSVAEGKLAYVATCDKRDYESFQHAQEVINYARRNHNKHRKATKIPKRAYRCECCGGVHLTSQKKKKKDME